MYLSLKTKIETSRNKPVVSDYISVCSDVYNIHLSNK